MKNTLLILLALGWLSINSIAVAQSPATIKKSDNDTLCQKIGVEIISEGGMHFDHPTHPATGITCPFVKGFTTSQTYSWYLWESSYFSPQNDETIIVDIDSCGYIKVTVGDQNGNIGSDSIWFHVRNANVPPMENFIMEIDDDLHANFSGIATEDHHNLLLKRGYVPGQFIHNENLFPSPGEWSFRDTTASYSNDSLWIYSVKLYDLCGSCSSLLVPGVLLETEGQNLTIKSILQNEIAPMVYSTFNFRYCIYTVDGDGNRHEFMDNYGNPIILQPETTSWPLQGPHIDPYYQVGVGRQLENGSYELLSLSNKVSNPWPDTDNIDENDDVSFSIYPNPANGHFTAVGTGVLSIWNLNGQKLFQQEIDGEISINLTAGIYISSLSTKHGNYHKKIVVY